MAPSTPVSTSYTQTLARAQAGTLSFPQFVTYWTARSFSASASQVLSEVTTILAAVNVTEPTQTWVKNGWVSIKDGQVSVTTQTTQAYPGQGTIGGLGQGASNAVDAALTPIQIFQKLASALTNANTWARVAEFAVGGILVAVGANAMLKGRK